MRAGIVAGLNRHRGPLPGNNRGIVSVGANKHRRRARDINGRWRDFGISLRVRLRERLPFVGLRGRWFLQALPARAAGICE